MKKEKTVRTYQRRTKTGKVVTVKQHTAKYDAAEALKEVAKKKGAGDEMLQRKLDAEWQKIEDAFMKEHPDFEDFDEEGVETKEQAALTKKMLTFSRKHPEWKGGIDIGGGKKARIKEKVTKGGAPKESSSDYGFTADEYKAWYHWDQDADPKNKTALKVEKALKKQMGTKAYNKYFDDLTDNYSARGHNKAFKGLSETLSAGAEKKTSASGKESKSQLTKEIAQQDKYVKHLMRLHKDGVKDKQMGSYIAAEQKILSDLKKHKGDFERRDLDSIEEKFAKKSKLSYMEDGLYRGKDGKVYRISVHPLTGEATLHSMTGVSTGKSSSKSDDEKPRMHTIKTPKGTTTLPVMKTLGKVGETRYTYDSAGNIYKPGKAGGAPHIKLSDKKATEILDKLNISSRKFSAQVKESFSKGTTPKKPKSTAGVTVGASAVKYNGKTYMVTKDGSVETSTGRKVGKTLSAKVLKEKEGTTSLGIPPKGSKSKSSKVKSWDMKSVSGLTKQAFRKLPSESREALDSFMKEHYKGKKFDLGHPYGYYTVGGISITNEHTNASESKKKLAVKLIPHVSFGDPGSPRYATIEGLKKLKTHK